MRRVATIIACISILAGVQQAQAHDVDITIVGFQYAFSVGEIPPEFGLAGYVNTPAGAIATGQTASGDRVASVTNQDVVAHTFTECTADCDQAEGTAEGAAFDITLEPGESKGTVIEPGTYIVMCTIHPWMRASVKVNGA